MVKLGTDINEAKRILQSGELVGIPTETVYGLAGNALNPSAVKKIFDVKERPNYNPLIVHIGEISQLKKYACQIPSVAQVLAEKFWPGPLTLLLNKQRLVPGIVTGGLDTVGIRVPNHPITLALLKTIDFPLAAPSANPFGYISPTTARHVKDQLGDKIEYILDGGPCDKGLESTIIGFADGKPILYRLGAITVERIEKVIGHPLEIQDKANHRPLGPGMLPYHYAPITNAVLTDDIYHAIAQTNVENVGLISVSTELFHPKVRVNRILSLANDLEEAGKKLYSTLRYMDNQDLDLIIIERMPDFGLGKTINDRLEKAVARKEIKSMLIDASKSY